MAAGAIIPQHTAVQFNHLPASRHLVQAVNVLGDHTVQPPFSFQFCQGKMCKIGPGLSQHIFPVISKKFFRVLHKEPAAERFFRRIALRRMGQAVFTAEILQPAFC